jgi:nucleotide-binding universal stress UspA family protein
MAMTYSKLLAQTIAARDSERRLWKRRWLDDAVRSKETVLVERPGEPESVLLVADRSLELRWWLRRVIVSIRPARVRCLGVVDVSLPWYAGLAFGASELGEMLRAAHDEALAEARRATQASALWLARREISAVAEWSVGRFDTIVLTRASEAHADLIVLAARGHAPADLRTIIGRAACSVLIVRGVPVPTDGRADQSATHADRDPLSVSAFS